MKKTLLAVLASSVLAFSLNGFAAQGMGQTSEMQSAQVVKSVTQTAQAQAQVNVNEAQAEEIAQMIKGVGPVKAQAIVSFRQENGPFLSMEELTQVKGIGLKTLEKNRAVLSFD